jgi:TonB family protein
VAVNPQTTVAVVLGAGEYPQSPALNRVSFATSAKKFLEYLTSSDGFNLPTENLLDRFDTDLSAGELLGQIADFLNETTGDNAKPRAEDVLFYYVGHGGFVGSNREYFLTVRNTREGLEGSTSVRIEDLASTLRSFARRARKYLILDCCFAASAFAEFQATSVSGYVSGQVLDALPPDPKRGTALLCSSGPREVSIAPSDQALTMFSGALIDVLSKGDPDGGPALSLEEVGNRVQRLLREKYPENWIRPEVHSPEIHEGDIANVAVFPNRSFLGSASKRPESPQSSKANHLKALIDSAFAKQEWSEAVSYLSELLSIAPDDLDAQSKLTRAKTHERVNKLYTTGIEHFEQGHYKDAQRSFETVAELYPEYLDVRTLLTKVRAVRTRRNVKAALLVVLAAVIIIAGIAITNAVWKPAPKPSPSATQNPSRTPVTQGSSPVSEIPFSYTYRFSNAPIPLTANPDFSYGFTPVQSDSKLTGTVRIKQVRIAASVVTRTSLMCCDVWVFLGPQPFGLPAGIVKGPNPASVDVPASVAPTQLRVVIGNGGAPFPIGDTQIRADYDFESGGSSAYPHLDSLKMAVAPKMKLMDGLYAQVFAWNGNQYVNVEIRNITVSVTGEKSVSAASEQVSAQQELARTASASDSTRDVNHTAPEGAKPSAGFRKVPDLTDRSQSRIAVPQRVRVSQDVSQGLLIHRVQPMYPPLARQARIQGAVILQAEIGKDGTIENLRLISGHPLLVQAAMDAVKQWRYKPYFLYGEPVAVETQITVNFTLAGG